MPLALPAYAARLVCRHAEIHRDAGHKKLQAPSRPLLLMLIPDPAAAAPLWEITLPRINSIELKLDGLVKIAVLDALLKRLMKQCSFATETACEVPAPLNPASTPSLSRPRRRRLLGASDDATVARWPPASY